jgi:monoterpene epsilon-lactone hydrolase
MDGCKSLEIRESPFLDAAPSARIPSLLIPYMTSPRMARRFRNQYQSQEDKVEESLVAQYRLRVEPKTIADVAVLEITPPRLTRELEDAVVFNVHGGGFFLGTARDRPSLMIAHELGIRVISVEYTLAPEAAFPVAIDQCLAVYRHLATRHDPRRVVGVSTSAGGAIQLGMMHKARAQHLPMPAALGLFTPGTDISGAGDSAEANGNGRDTENRAMSLGFIRLYIGDADPRDPFVSPLYGDFDDTFAPSIMTTGTRDFNMSGSIRLHEKLTLAGVPNVLHIGEGMWHGFNYQPDVPEAIRARGLVNDFLLAALRGRPREHTPAEPAIR